MLLTEIVNKSIFNRGFEKTKTILNGKYELTAKCGIIPYNPNKKINVSSQFRIEAKKGKQLVGWVNFEERNNSLVAIDVVVVEEHRRKGIATAMYDFAKELGNSISPSSMQTKLGKEFWKNDKNEVK